MNQAKTILIVEDEKSIMHVLHDKLVHEGFSVLQAVDGEQGLRLALEQHPDLILLDIMIPKLNGTEVLKKLRQDMWGATAQVFMLTNLSDGVNIYDSVLHNVAGYFVKKDWKLEDMLVKIKESLSTEEKHN